MPRVQTRVAAKDYPDAGIKKGDTYYYTKIKLQRGGIVKRSLRPFKRSELTMSDYLGQLYAWEDAKAEITSMDEAQDMADQIGNLGEEQQGKFDNMPEGLQQGDTGQTVEQRAQACEQAKTEIEDIISEWESAKSDWETEIETYKEEKALYDTATKAHEEWEANADEDHPEDASGEPDVPDEPDLPDNTNTDGDEPEFDESEWLDRVKDVSVDG